MELIRYGKHKGKTLDYVVKNDPNYALHAHVNYNWFPKLTREQITYCSKRYRRLFPIDLRSGLHLRDWSTYDMADYGDGWV